MEPLTVFFQLENAEDLITKVGIDAAILTFQSPKELLGFVQKPPHSSDNELPAFEVLNDSVGPDGKQFGMIRRQIVIAHLKNLLE